MKQASLPKDLYTGLSGMITQDPDLSYRPRIMYGQYQVYGEGRWWQEERGDCVDNVIRGCFNNGTCVAPDTCQCAEGWSGFDCTTPICPLGCAHNGNCTLPGICSCELGWEGDDCMTATCAQDCVNGGRCVAPDTCQCVQYPMSFYDMAVPAKPPLPEAGGSRHHHRRWGAAIHGVHRLRLLRADLRAGERVGVRGRWRFYRNVEDFARNIKYVLPLSGYQTEGYREGAGHGPSAIASCVDVRCPFFDEMVTNNLGQTFQSGCGFDPLFGTQIGYGNVGGGSDGGDTFADGDTDETIGCCLDVLTSAGRKYLCRRCIGDQIELYNNYTCVMDGDYVVLGSTFTDYKRTILNMALKGIPTCVDADGDGTPDNGDPDATPKTCAETIMDQADALRDACNAMTPFCKVEDDPDNADYEGFIINDVDSYTQVTTKRFRPCGPTNYVPTPRQELKERPYVIQPQPYRNKTSMDFLCSIRAWTEGDYLDDGDLNENHPLIGVGVEYDTRPDSIGTTPNCQTEDDCTGFPAKRHVRRNHANITYSVDTGKREYQPTVAGEGIYFCPKAAAALLPIPARALMATQGMPATFHCAVIFKKSTRMATVTCPRVSTEASAPRRTTAIAFKPSH